MAEMDDAIFLRVKLMYFIATVDISWKQNINIMMAPEGKSEEQQSQQATNVCATFHENASNSCWESDMCRELC